MDLLNEYRQRTFFSMPGGCNEKLQSLLRQISDYCGVNRKGTPYRTTALFVVQYLFERHIITYGEDRDLTVHYSKEEAEQAIAADKEYLEKMGGGNVQRNDVNVERFKKLAPDVDLPSWELDLGSAASGFRPPEDAKKSKDVNFINRFISTLIQTGRFNCTHVDDLVTYSERRLRGYYSPKFRGKREGQAYTDVEGYEITGKTVQLADFKFNPDYKVSYVTTSKLSKQEPQKTTASQKDLILNNANSVFLFFTAYYIPTFILSYRSMGDTTAISDALIASSSIEDFEKRLEASKEIVPTMKEYDDDQIEEIINNIDDFLDITQDFKEHTSHYMFGVADTTSQDLDANFYDIIMSTPESPILTRSTRRTGAKKKSMPVIDEQDIDFTL